MRVFRIFKRLQPMLPVENLVGLGYGRGYGGRKGAGEGFISVLQQRNLIVYTHSFRGY